MSVVHTGRERGKTSYKHPKKDKALKKETKPPATTQQILAAALISALTRYPGVLTARINVLVEEVKQLAGLEYMNMDMLAATLLFIDKVNAHKRQQLASGIVPTGWTQDDVDLITPRFFTDTFLADFIEPLVPSTSRKRGGQEVSKKEIIIRIKETIRRYERLVSSLPSRAVQL